MDYQTSTRVYVYAYNRQLKRAKNLDEAPIIRIIANPCGVFMKPLLWRWVGEEQAALLPSD